MPAYHFDPYIYRIHKMKGGSFKNFNDKSYLALSDQQIAKHLRGEQLIGIYPLLKDNTSWFIAADFDKQNWKEECLLFIKACANIGMPAYLERSRSGEGGHVWIFFDKPYPAVKSRRIFTDLLEQAGIFSVFDKGSSFDRLFPNQDFLSGKGLGNLIALPFHKLALENGNSCFIDLSNDNWMPFKDQWRFLSTLQKVSTKHLDSLYQTMVSNQESTKLSQDISGKLQIVLSNDLRLNRSGLTSELIKFLTDELNFSNSEYFVKKKTGKSTWGTQRFFKCLEETENQVLIPRGFAGRLLRFCKQHKINFEFLDKREKQKAINFTSNLTLRSYQDIALSVASKKDFGIITAPPGSGKTVIGLRIIQEKQQHALIIVHRKQLMDQWIEKIQTFLGIPKNEIGRIGQGKAKLKKDVTVAMIQSLAKYIEKTEDRSFVQSFGTVIIDECHHIPSDTYRNTISKLLPYYQYGLTATPFRKGNDGKLISIYLGETIAEIRTNDIEQYKHPVIIIRKTALNVPYNSKTDTFETLSKILVHDSTRNKLIIEDVIDELNKQKKVVILTERKEHIDALNQFLKQSYETITLSGDDSKSSRKSKWKLINDGNYQALITTGQFFGEGTDLQNASCLFLVYPFSFKGKLIQYIGRVQRSEITPIIYDYHDYQIDYLNRPFLKRNLYYRQFARQASLFDEQEKSKALSKTLTIAKKIKVLIDHLDFRYGAVAFNYQIPGNSVALEFEVENDDLRPEFDVLKAFFSKILKSKYVEVEIHAEFENNTLVAQSANSKDIEKINQKIIESVKFRFIQNNIVGRKKFAGSDENLLHLHQLQSDQSNESFYNSEEELLNDLLKSKDVKHFRQLRFLASRHENNIMKLRFVLNPFSFAFLLSGNEGYHLVLETLNTEEATYIWHFDKNITTLKQNISIIDEDLNLIRNEGRQSFVESQPENFSRIVHDYSDERKGFVIWKDMLEERLI
jgi:superfamily II DNA or RNA helicase